jgi:NADPH-dependent 2,4-dienoyl-CoA reductase/sulfur reductase-like enzyme
VFLRASASPKDLALPILTGTMHQQLGGNGTAGAHGLPRDESPHVCVVGAGIAGLRCAEVLVGRGVNVTVIEARDRIGGRVCRASRIPKSMLS